MRVAVLGSWREEDRRKWKLRETPEKFQEASQQIGRALIERGHSLIVGSDSKNTADYHAVTGALDALDPSRAPADAPRIVVIRPSSTDDARAFDKDRRSRLGVFVDHPVDAASWAVVKLVQTQLADALILIAGAEKTEQAGLTAAVSKKPLACVGSFGGAAARLNQRFVSSPTTWGYQPHETRKFPHLQEPFSDHVLTTALEIAWIEDAPKLMLIHGRSRDRDLLKKSLQESGVPNVIVLADEFTPSKAIPDKFERFASSVDGAIALLTPDDTGALAVEPATAAPRARENVWVEVGWFWGHRGRSKLLLLKKGAVTIPSDLGNVEICEYNDLSECNPQIASFIARLRSASDVDDAE